MYYYQKNIGDYRAATAHLTLLEHGVYNWLLDTYYSNEQPLPLDERVLFRLTLARSEDEKQAVRDVLGEFFTKTDAGWIQTRCDEEISKYHSKGDANRTNGKKGGRPPKTEPTDNPNETQDKPINNPSETQTEPTDNPSETQTEPTDNLNQEPRTINQEPLTNNKNTPVSESESAGDELPAVCVVLRGLGVSIAEQRRNLDKITALVHRGAGLEHFTAGLEVAKEAGKGFDYSLGVVKRRLDDAQNAATNPRQAKGKMSREDYANVPDASLADAVRKQNAAKQQPADDGRTLEAT